MKKITLFCFALFIVTSPLSARTLDIEQFIDYMVKNTQKTWCEKGEAKCHEVAKTSAESCILSMYENLPEKFPYPPVKHGVSVIQCATEAFQILDKYAAK